MVGNNRNPLTTEDVYKSMKLGQAGYCDGKGFPCGIKLLIHLRDYIRVRTLLSSFIYLLYVFFLYIFGAIQFLDLYSATYCHVFVDDIGFFFRLFDCFRYICIDIVVPHIANNKFTLDHVMSGYVLWLDLNYP